MTTLLKFELKRAFINRMFVISVLAGCAISLVQTISFTLPAAHNLLVADEIYPPTIYNSYLGLTDSDVYTFVYYIIFPLFAALPFSASYLTDLKSGYVKEIFTRGKKVNYMTAKLIAVFLSAGAAAVIPLLFNLWSTALLVPAVIPDASTGFFVIFSECFAADVFYSHPMVYIMIYDVLLFFTSGVLACTALAFSYVFKYSALIMVTPFFVFMAISFGSSLISEKLPLNISNWILPSQINQPLNLGAAIVELLVIFVVTCAVYYIKGLKDETY